MPSPCSNRSLLQRAATRIHSASALSCLPLGDSPAARPPTHTHVHFLVQYSKGLSILAVFVRRVDRRAGMRFLSIYKSRETGHPPTEQEMADMTRLIEKFMKTGELVATEGCLPTAQGAKVRLARLGRDRNRWPLHRGQGSCRRVRDSRGEIEGARHRAREGVSGGRRRGRVRDSPGLRRAVPIVEVLLHNVRSLYNVGAFFRTADAVGLSRLYLSGFTGSPPSKQIAEDRARLGAERSVGRADPLRLSTPDEAQAGKRQRSRRSRTLSTWLRLASTFPVLVVFGHEVEGLPVDIAGAMPTRGTAFR